jgi:thiamine biosynthesis lipoprotein
MVKTFTSIVVAFFLVSLSSAYGSGSRGISREQYYLGTFCRITLFEKHPDDTFIELFSRIREIDDAMSTNREKSEVNAVNRSAGIDPAAVSPDTFEVVKEGIEYGRITNGTFDITIGPLVELWGIGRESFKVPAEETIRERSPLVDYRFITLRDNYSIFLEKRNMRLDLGGIAKGYAADAAAGLLRARGIESALVDLGGNILALGNKPGGSMWRIGIQNPLASRGIPIAAVKVTGKAVVTSGTYERYSEEKGRRYHHILDPSTGFPAENGLLSVSIVADSAVAADCLSTGVFVLGLDSGMALIESLAGVEAIFVTEEKEIYISSGLADIIEILDQDFRLKHITRQDIPN